MWNSVPALMELLIQAATSRSETLPPSLRLVWLSGDWIPLQLPYQIKVLHPGVQVISMGGATEASIWSIIYPIDHLDASWTSIPYGRPMVNQSWHVLNDALEPCPVWVPGQLYIGGIGLAQGYWRDTEKTRASFIIHPKSGERLYRTGDLGRYLPDGMLEFLGREDFQVKIGGHRIELGEIEATLLQHGGVQAAVVTAVGEARGHRRLVAYVVPEEEQSLDDQALLDVLQAQLPAYMIPATFMHLQSLPLTSNGKVDRRALPEPAWAQHMPEDGYVAPRTPVEEALVKIWSKVLSAPQVGIHDNFFDLGGDSILSTQIVTQAYEAGLQLTPGQVFEHQTIAALAAVAEVTSANGALTVVKAAPSPAESDIEDVLPLAPGQHEMLWQSLSGSAAPPSGANIMQWCWGFQGDLDLAALQRAWQQAVDGHPALRSAFRWGDDEAPQQVVYRDVPLPLTLHDWRGLAPEVQQQQLDAYLAAERHQGFALSRAPLSRLTLFRMSNDDHACLWSLHHLLLDAWAIYPLLGEVMTRYEALGRGQEVRRPAAVSYRDYLAWVQRQAQSQAEQFWRRTLQGFTTPTPLGGRKLPAPGLGEPVCFARLRQELPAHTTAALQTFARDHRLTLYTLLQGSWSLVLQHLSGEYDVVFGSVYNGRPTDLPRADSVVGMLANVVPMRVRIEPEQNLVAWLEQLQADRLASYPYAYSPFHDIRTWSALPLEQPLFESMLLFQNLPTAAAARDQGRRLRVRSIAAEHNWPYALSLTVHPGAALRLSLSYDCRYFDDADAAHILHRMQTLLEVMAESPASAITDLQRRADQAWGEGINR